MLILFDLDDTLLDHSSAYRAAAGVLHRKFASNSTFDDFFARWLAAQELHYPRFLTREVTYDEHRRARVRDAIDATIGDNAADEIFAHYLVEYESGWRLFDDAIPCLERLSEYRLGIISNGRGREQRAKLERLRIAGHFAGIFISDDCCAAKPAAAVFLQACSELGESPSNSVYVGDRYDIDAEGARGAGLHGVWLDRNRMGTEIHQRPIIQSLDELDSPFIRTLADSVRTPT